MKTKKYNGFRSTYFYKDNEISVCLIVGTDDGTFGDYLVLEFNNIPYATISNINADSMKQFIKAMQTVYDNRYGSKIDNGQEK